MMKFDKIDHKHLSAGTAIGFGAVTLIANKVFGVALLPAMGLGAVIGIGVPVVALTMYQKHHHAALPPSPPTGKLGT